MKTMFVLCSIVMMAVAVDASLITNGDFDTDGQMRWRSDLAGRIDWVGEPTGWYSSLYHNGEVNGAYGDLIDGYGSGNVAGLKAEADNYYQQSLAGVDAGTSDSYTISYDGGIRYHPTYISTARDITLRVSLWDVTADVELAGVDVVTAYSSSATSLEARSHTLVYDNTGLSGHQLALRFTNTTLNPVDGANPNQVLIDNVSVQLSGSAILVSPAPNGAAGVAVDTGLFWTAPSSYSPSEYRVYFGSSEPNSVLADYGLTELTAGQHPYTAASISPSPSPLDNLTTYYWVVDTYEPNLPGADILNRGEIWSFTTITANAQLAPDSGPFDQAVEIGTDVEFSVSGINITDYQWYGPAGLISGADSATLTVSNVQQSDEGLYYCVVDNSQNPNPVTSNDAMLVTIRDISEWNFEDNLSDSIGSNDGTAVIPVYIADSIVGSTSLQVIADDPNTYVTVAGVDELNNSVSFTIEAWVKPATLPDYAAIVSSRGSNLQDPPLISGGYVLYTHSDGRVGFWVHDGTDFDQLTSSGDEFVVADQWNYVVAVFDKGTSTVYINGRQSGQAGDMVLVRNDSTDLYIGAGANEVPDAGFYFDGLIDQVKISSGVTLDAYAVATNYVTAFPDAVICVDQAGLDYDSDGDCDVDIVDFAALAADWLNCNRVAGINSNTVNCN